VAAVALEALGVRKSYTRDGRTLPVLDVERFTAGEGEFVTVVGPSGCGKSTFLHIVGGFIPADAGLIRVHGRPVAGPGPDRGMMFQEFALFPGAPWPATWRGGWRWRGCRRPSGPRSSAGTSS
jgi:NitT/TauT family transport system ATP-binding protein